jgi:hypothetical protein
MHRGTSRPLPASGRVVISLTSVALRLSADRADQAFLVDLVAADLISENNSNNRARLSPYHRPLSTGAAGF